MYDIASIYSARSVDDAIRALREAARKGGADV